MWKTLSPLLILVMSGCASPGAGPLGAVSLQSAIEESPDPGLTPGALCTREDKDYDGDRYPEGIPHCRRNVTRHTKVVVAAAYGVSEEELTGYEIDHWFPLGLGGSNSRDNLWPLIHDEARRKAKVEEQLYLQLRDGAISQSDAIDAIQHWQDLADPE
jgi:hypothetical protein